MGPLFLLNGIVIAVCVISLIILKKTVRSEAGVRALFLILPLLTVFCHYSILLVEWIATGSCYSYLNSNPNLVLPIYPCNVVMWCALLFGLLKRKDTRLGRFLADFIFFFGVLAALVGLFANVDFIRNPDLSNYHVLKGVLAHGFMLLNILAFPVFGFIKIDLPRNMCSILGAIVLMLVIGAYCTLVIDVIADASYAWEVNSMFLLHSPFEGAPWISYWTIAGTAFAGFFVIFCIAELFAYPKGSRWLARIHKK